MDDRLTRATRAPALLDTRHASAFAACHLIGAVNIPQTELRNRSGELPPATDAAGLTVVVTADNSAAVLEALNAWTIIDAIEENKLLWDAARRLELIEIGAAPFDRFLWRPSPHLAPVCALVEQWVPAHTCGGRRAIDLGCGRGRDAIWLASRPGWSVVGIDNQSFFLSHLREFASRQRLGDDEIRGVCLDLYSQASWAELASHLRPPLALVNFSRFLHRGLMDFVVRRMPHGCVLAVHHFVEGAVSLKSGRSIKPHDVDKCSLRPGELAERYAGAVEVLLDEAESSCDGGRPMCSFAGRKPPLFRLVQAFSST